MINFYFAGNNCFDLSIFQYGYEECEAMHTFGPAKRNHYIIHCVLEGNGTFISRVDGKESIYKLKKGDAFLIEPNQIIHYFADAYKPWTYTWIEFEGLKAIEFLEMAGLNKYSPIYKPINKTCTDEIFSYLLDIVYNPDFNSAMILSKAYGFFGSLINYSSNKKREKQNSLQSFYVQTTVDFIESNYMNNITVEDLANNLKLNRSYFSKIFKKITQKTPQDFLITYRMNKACGLLSTKNLPISDIAAKCGYENPFHFSRAFKKIMGLSPQKYRDLKRD